MACRDGCGDGALRRARTRPESPGERVRGRPARRHDRRRAEGRAREGGGRVQRSRRRIGRERRLGTHLRRRARRPRQGREGRQGQRRAVPRPHQHQPARQRRADRLRRAGPVVDRLPSEVQGERPLLRPLRLAAVQRRVARRPLHRRSEEPGRAHARADDEDRQGADEHPAALLQPLRRHDRLRARRQALHRQGRRRLGGRSARRRAAARHASRQDAAHRRRHARTTSPTRCRRTTRSRRPTSRS